MNSAPPTEHKPPTESNGAHTTEPVPTPTPTHPASAAPAKQARNPLHGVTLEAMVVALSEHFGWKELGQRIPVRCFQSDPSVSSSLKFLRKTPWAREKVESLYLFMLREQRRNGPR
ncbi:MAG: VF530 family DNA-binding protein [Acidovorax temperans]|uniref:VF530 family protein n=1 Tax=Acidovorax temperans TaxID=80878 RepID=UPI00391C3B4B